jgi:hypothetical protein
MILRWQYSGKALWRLSAGIAVLFLAAAVGRSAPGAAGEPDWQALLQKLQSLDTTKPEAVATLRDVLAEMIRGREAGSHEIELKKELEARTLELGVKTRENEALRAELQALRARPPAAASAVPSAAAAPGKSTSKRTKSALAPAATPPAAANLPAGASPSATAAAAAPTALFGKKGLKKLHRADCVFGSRIPETDRVYFKSVQEAAAAGYEPCKVCKPGG